MGVFRLLRPGRQGLRTTRESGGEKSLGAVLGQQMKFAPLDVTVVVLPGTGHWLGEGRPKETMDALLKFL
jgi:hypothetical protein